MRAAVQFLSKLTVLATVALVVTGCCCGLPLIGSPGGLDELGAQLPAPSTTLPAR